MVSQRRRLVEALDERSRELEAEEDAFARLSVSVSGRGSRVSCTTSPPTTSR